MSFGRPPSINVGFQVTAPDRGSFPLDHFGECKEKMTLYMNCLKENGSTSSPCRVMSRDYLDCRNAEVSAVFHTIGVLLTRMRCGGD
ncbi:hypothetical protein DFP72DRAFT_797631 [Ephemerocybe angulata]|uniref:Cytochrome c oxidase assembly protein COX19 n=1 Tax=Ephemerocybe angulata TaxID=980116 RepID=A0A8H6II14_9AGAR|nr:hypothetical protein DFP72DRAFT_797631 [Tulosesus angulatus]